MQNTQFKLYYQNVVGLVRSMVIKLPIVADSMNKELTDRGLEVPSDPHEWRYYKHLAGEYHHSDVDMVITSLDTSEEIILTRENLNIHKKTRNLYEVDTAYQDAVMTRYPLQSNLVTGILFPVDKDVAIKAKVGSVLYHSPNHIEKQETSLVQRVEAWVESWFYRTHMQAYQEGNDLFAYTIVCQMNLLLPSVIMDVRFEYIHTAQTHSFHIRNYLASNFHLDDYISYMNTKQMMYLYRNLRYIKSNIGKQEIFDTLIDILFTERSLPTYGYELAQGRPDFEESIYPVPKFIRSSLNFNTGYTTNEFVDYDISDVTYKESIDTASNALYLQRYTKEAEGKTEQSRFSRLPTKIIEVTAIDPEDAQPFKLIDVMLNQWIYYASTGRYTMHVDLLNQQSGEEFKIGMDNLVLLYFYAYYRGYHGVVLDDIPTVTAVGVQTDDVLLSKDYLPYLKYNHWTAYDDEVNFFVKTQVYPDDLYRTAEDFIAVSENILKTKRRRYNYTYKVDRYTDKLARSTMFNLNYRDHICDLNPQGIATYPELLKSYGITPDLMTEETWQDLAISCLDAATLFNTNARVSLSDIQAAMVGIFNRLTSYTTQVLKDVVSQDSLVPHPMVVNPGETPGDQLMEQNWYDHNATILKADSDVELKSTNFYPTIEVIDIEIVENRDVSINHVAHARTSQVSEEHFITVSGLSARGVTVEEITE